MSESISQSLAKVKERIAKAARAAGRDPADITLVAVSKTHSPERIAEALDAGQRCFGENRVQEAMAKFPQLRADHPDLELHLVGPLQSNKAADAVATFDVIQSVDRPKIVRALAKEMERQGRRPRCFIQVNTGEEPQKAGVAPGELSSLLELCREAELPLVGLMCIPPVEEPPAPHFALLRQLAEQHDLPLLSMGMSGDYETAVELGATHVRIGTAIFGERPKA